MAVTLYRKYRPKLFEELVGQRHIQVTLTHEIASGKLAHAYVFTGPRGVGKTTVARLLARAVNCTGRKDGMAEPDNTCPACQAMLNGQALDLIEIDAASQTGVDHVRENIIANARVAPASLKTKVFIIDEVHMLSIGAFNALLKLLEEPPDHALFILATTEVHKVPETILSRCQRFDFHRVSLDALKERLQTIVRAEGVQVDDDVLDDVARRAEGSVRDAESLLGQLLALGEKRVTADVAAIALPRTNVQVLLDFFDPFVRRDRVAALTTLNTIVEEGVSLPHFLTAFLAFVRGLMLLKVNPALERGGLIALDAQQEQELLAALPSLTLEDLIRILEAFHDLERQVKHAPLPQLPVELAILKAIPVNGATEHRAAPPPPRVTAAAPPTPKPKRAAKKSSAVTLPAAASTRSVELTAVEQAWPRIITAMKSVNHGIALLLKSVAPSDVKGDTLILGVRFPFHAERLVDVKNRAALERVLAETLSTPLKVKCVVVPRTNADDAVVQGIADAFGGEVL
ncbi:MAG: DNA polymerase III subunit gamma/tau [Candidatus Kerfeldbacteria bacterium]|nr:DNA polymerase III subunit gamma/tau [Candidatus Kerfeldbacteria bacterium]